MGSVPTGTIRVGDTVWRAVRVTDSAAVEKRLSFGNLLGAYRKSLVYDVFKDGDDL